MSCFLFKLCFTAPVHFGPPDAALSLYSSEETFCADTLFSALCHTALQAEGEMGLEHLCNAVKSGELHLSDAMPYCGEDFFLPKPYFHSSSSEELPPKLRKTVKKLRWLPVTSFERFSDSIHGGAPFVPSEIVSFGIHEEYTKAAITEGKDAVPYQVGVFRFFDNCGLWFMLCCPESEGEYYEKLIKLLGMSGIGGKISSGYGSFEIDDTILLDEPFDEQTQWLHDALVKRSDSYLLLTTSLPQEDELESALNGAFYQLTRRGGFIRSDTYSDEPQKKDTKYFIAAGSVLKRRFSGTLFKVADGNHPVYRCSSPVMLGVSL